MAAAVTWALAGSALSLDASAFKSGHEMSAGSIADAPRSLID
jgi:hypothetical protein